MKQLKWLGAIGLIGWILGTSLYQIDGRQMAAVTQFGKPVRHSTDPGLHFKLPFPFQRTLFFDKRIQIFNPKPMEFLTADKQNIIADGFICWRIQTANPLPFLVSMGDKYHAELFLTDIFTSEMGASLGRYTLKNFISTDTADLQTPIILKELTAKCTQSAAENGIEILSVEVKKFNLPEENKPSVYARMTEERNRIAKKYRAEGQEKAAIIRAEADREKSRIVSESTEKAQVLLGEGEAESMRIFSAAHAKSPEFYSFLRTLDAYEKFLNERTTIVLSPDHELLRLLTRGK